MDSADHSVPYPIRMWRTVGAIGVMYRFFFLALALAACAPNAQNSAKTCPISEFTSLIGTPVEEAVFPLTLEHRIIAQGAAVTMDHVPDRLNVHLDKTGRIARLSCG